LWSLLPIRHDHLHLRSGETLLHDAARSNVAAMCEMSVVFVVFVLVDDGATVVLLGASLSLHWAPSTPLCVLRLKMSTRIAHDHDRLLVLSDLRDKRFVF
jgi:hypothetical protein